MTLKRGRLPQIWKNAIITPIYKKGLRNTALNYRSVSLTSVICRTYHLQSYDQSSDGAPSNI